MLMVRFCLLGLDKLQLSRHMYAAMPLDPTRSIHHKTLR